MNKKKRILVFIDWYLPGFKAGGPIRSLANLVEQLPFDFWIVTSLYDHYSDNPYPDIQPGVWQKQRENAHVMYLDKGDMNKALIQDLLQENPFDLVYFNSLFSLEFALKPLYFIKKRMPHLPVLLAPRGMLKSGALSVKAKKKRAFIFASRFIGLFKGIYWHATNETEAEEIRRHFGRKSQIRIAPNLPKPARIRQHIPEKKPGKLTLLTVGRISPEKGTLEGLKAVAAMQQGRVEWHIYGTFQKAEYVAECKTLAAKIPHADIYFHGEIEPALLPEKLEHTHFFYLTTLGENFGHAIAEALLAGVPAIISDRTPWRELASENAGWDLPLETDIIARKLEECAAMDSDEYEEMCRKTAAFGKKRAANPSGLKQNMELFASP